MSWFKKKDRSREWKTIKKEWNEPGFYDVKYEGRIYENVNVKPEDGYGIYIDILDGNGNSGRKIFYYSIVQIRRPLSLLEKYIKEIS